MNNENERRRCMALSRDSGEFVLGNDGYYLYWPRAKRPSALAAYHLRWLADELDKMNAAWDAMGQADPLVSGQPDQGSAKP